MHSIVEAQRTVELQPIELQHINVKLLLKSSEELDLDPVIPVFHSWIQGQVFDELLLDVADYRHVPGGPGVVLIGHEADYSIDNTDDRLGVRYNRKTVLNSSNQERLEQAIRAVLNACQRLETDVNLKGKLRFNGQDIEIFVNDRLLAPNREETCIILAPQFERFLDKLYKGAEYSISYPDDRRRFFGASITTLKPFATATLLENMAP